VQGSMDQFYQIEGNVPWVYIHERDKDSVLVKIEAWCPSEIHAVGGSRSPRHMSTIE